MKKDNRVIEKILCIVAHIAFAVGLINGLIYDIPEGGLFFTKETGIPLLIWIVLSLIDYAIIYIKEGCSIDDFDNL